MPWLINAQQVDSFRKNQKNLVIVDATWHGADAQATRLDFMDKHIPGARFMDLNLFNDPKSQLPNFLTRDEKQISEHLGALGIRPDCKIIFYDRSEMHTSCRALWMMKVFGHSSQLLYILDGGLQAWETFGGKCESGEPVVTAKTYAPKFQEKYLRTLAQMKDNQLHPKEQVIDARHPIRYAGGPEPRPGLRLGHMPGSYCFPYSVLFDGNGNFLPLDKLRRRLEGVAIDILHPTITTCGSGMTAPVLNFLLDLLGNENNAVYNGSWTEWGAKDLYPGEKSLDERPIESTL